MSRPMPRSNALDQVDLSHHAYCIVGGEEKRLELISALEKKHKIKREGNPDFYDRRFEAFTIGDARELKSSASTRPTGPSGKKIFIVTADGMTSEAQNALLKLLEEPPEYAHFFLVLPSAHILLPTVKSRISFLGGRDEARRPEASDSMEQAREFLALSPAKRLEHIKELMEDISKEKKTKQDAIRLLGALEAQVRSRGVKQNIEALDAILLSSKYATDRAPSMKMLLEYVALSLS